MREGPALPESGEHRRSLVPGTSYLTCPMCFRQQIVFYGSFPRTVDCPCGRRWRVSRTFQRDGFAWDLITRTEDPYAHAPDPRGDR